MYKIEIFDDQFTYKSVAMIDRAKVSIELDFLAYDSYTITTPDITAGKGDLVHITDEDNNFIADGMIGDIRPDEGMQKITIRPLNSLFDAEVFYTAVSDCITWLASNIDGAFMTNPDTLQNRPITLTYTPASQNLPLTGFNLHETVNILSVAISALRTYGVVMESRLDLVNKRFTVNIYQQTATKVLEASLDNVLTKEITIGDSYGSANKATIRKVKVVDDETTVLGSTAFYQHPDGTIDTTNSNRITPVFYKLENLELEDDMTTAEWNAAALSRAKELLTPEKYDNEIDLVYSIDDQLAHPMDLEIGTQTTIYIEGKAYSSILTGKRIEGRQVALIFGVTREELTKKLSIEKRETMTFENTVSAVMREVAQQYEKKGSGGGGPEPTTTTPKMDGTAAVGTETAYARGDHVHPTDTTRAPLASPAFTGNPTGTTQSAGNNSTRLATTAFVYGEVHGKRVLDQQTVTLSTTSSVAVASTATTTGTITAVTGATDYILIPKTCNYGVFTALSRSSTTINATLRNVSNAAHTLGASVLVIAIG